MAHLKRDRLNMKRRTCPPCPHPTACGRDEVCLIGEGLQIEPMLTLAERAREERIEASLAASRLLNSCAAAMSVIDDLRARESQYNPVPGWLKVVMACVLLAGVVTVAAKLWKLWS